MRRGSWFVAAAVLAGSVGLAVPRADAALLPARLAPIDAVLQQTLATTTGTVRAVVRLDAVATSLQLGSLRALGLDVTPFEVLPIRSTRRPCR
jgi:hypothetical protein